MPPRLLAVLVAVLALLSTTGASSVESVGTAAPRCDPGQDPRCYIVTSRSGEAAGSQRCNDPGTVCTLDNAIRASFSDGGPSRIHFRIPTGQCPGGVCVISPAATYPAVGRSGEGGTVIDGFTQGCASGPCIAIDGRGTSGAGCCRGLVIRGSNNVVRGLRIQNFNDGVGILIMRMGAADTGGNLIERNHVVNVFRAIQLSVEKFGGRLGGNRIVNNTIVGSPRGIYLNTASLSRSIVTANLISNNVIRGSSDAAILLQAIYGGYVRDNNIIQNRILGGSGTGIRLQATGCGPTAGPLCVRRGTPLSVNGNTVSGNVVNRMGLHGIYLFAHNSPANVRGNVLARNTLRDNRGHGIWLARANGTPANSDGNRFVRNSTSRNTFLGINLGLANSVGGGGSCTGGSSGAPDVNNNLGCPAVTSTRGLPNACLVGGRAPGNASPGTTVRVDVYIAAPGSGDSAGASRAHGEGRRFIGTTAVAPGGLWSARVPLVAPGSVLTATASTFVDGTSEFAANLAISPGCRT
ncbi:MAG: hypothetical protein GEU28_07305 [Dehalococcoidia bacterium]|nr:hypothetical protein [Dehalococcoidia bacterium]